MSQRRSISAVLRRYAGRVGFWGLVNFAIAVVATWAHVWQLSNVPMGFVTDEVSIAYNAYLIGSTGEDEFGVAWPLYTRSVNDYKNPGYIYFSMLVTRITGLWYWTVRLPSALCWMIGTLFLYLLGRRLWWRPELRALLLLSLAFTPSLFCLSRIAFEVIGLYPVLALFLYAVQRGFDRAELRWAVVAGLAIGASTYMYTTFRLLAPLHCGLVLLCYGSAVYRRQLLAFAASALVAVIPFSWYLFAHGENLTKRYREIGYLHKPLPVAEKFQMFVERYLSYFDPWYVLRAGDPNLRHHTGFGGEFFLATVIGGLLAMAVIVLDKRQRARRFNYLLLGGLLLSPVSAGFTNDKFHSLRAFSMVVFAIVLSVHGYNYSAQLVSRVLLASRARASVAFRWLRPLPSVLVALVSLHVARNSAAFVEHYFGPYVAASIGAFEYYGFRQAVSKALSLSPTRVVFDNRRRGRHADLHANFVGMQLARRRANLPPLVPGRPRDVRPGEVLIFEDKKGAFPELHEGLPEGSLYVAAPYGLIPPKLIRR